MVHVRSGRIAVMVALMASLLAAQAVSAVADHDGVREKFPKAPVALECPETPPTYCVDPSPGNEAVVRVKVAKRALPIDRVCFTLRFEGDLLDAGESVTIKLSSDPLAGAFGFWERRNFADGRKDGVPRSRCSRRVSGHAHGEEANGLRL